MKILIVDDSRSNLLMMDRLIQVLGFDDITTARDGLIAIEKIEDSIKDNEYFDIIFLDIMMPGLTGFEVLEKVRQIEFESDFEDEKVAKIIMTTSLSDLNSMRKSFVYEADEYLVKPILKKNIVKALLNLKIKFPKLEEEEL